MFFSWMSLLRCIACVLLVGRIPVTAQRPGDCIRAGDDVDCIIIDTCSAHITVDQSSGQNCSMMVENGRSLDGMVCDRLVDAIESLALDHTVPRQISTCVVVYVYPTESGAPHVIPGLPPGERKRIISTNVMLRGVGDGSSATGRSKRQGRPPPEPVTTTPPMLSTPPPATGQPPLVKFEAAMGEDLNEARYVLQFQRTQLVVFKNIEFIGSFGIVGAELISVLAVEGCSFSGFIQGALDIFNSTTVIVRTSHFSGNGFATTFKPQSYRGHAGAISISYIQDSPAPFVNISNCTFSNNSAELVTAGSGLDNTTERDSSSSTPSFVSSKDPPSRGMPLAKPANELQAVRGGVISDQSFPGRGGGVALIFSVNRTSVRANIEDCLFEGNLALELGGGLYVLLDGLTNHTVTISRTRFVGNISPSTAGGLQITFLQEGKAGRAHQVLVEDCTFTSNQASYGGAVFFLPLTINVSALDDGQLGIFAHFKNCLFMENSAVEVGGAFGVAFYILTKSAQSILPLQFIDCNFIRNTVIGGGVVSTAYFPLSFHGSNVFSFNQGPSLAVVGSRVRLYGSLLFSDNSNTGSLDGGALYITSLGQLELTEAASLSFINNSGTLGAAIVVQNPPFHAAYSRLLYNPLCSVIHSNNTLPPDLWSASVTFSSNKAVVASAVFMNNLDFCSWTQLAPPFFDRSSVFRWDFVNFTEDSPNENSGHRISTNQSYSIQTPAVRLNIVQNQVIAFPGETISLGAFAVDELGVATSALFTLSDDSIVTLNGSQDANGELYRFTPSSLNLVKVGPNTQLDVSLRIRSGSRIGRREVASAKLIADNKKFLIISDAFNVSSRFCPPGRKLLGMGNFSECMCDTADVDIIDCDGRRVHLEEHLWGTAIVPKMGVSVDNLLVTVVCPGGYCQCTPLNTSGVLKCTHIFDERDPGAQCHCNRTGVLCGDCVSGSGFSALLDRCVSCSDAYSVLLVALVLVDAGIVLLLLAVSKPIPLWFYPVLYYLQLLPHFTTHFPVTFEQVRPFLVYVSSALGLYFPYDFCLYDEASALATYFFCYFPIIVGAVLSPIAVCFRKRRSPRDSWHGVWWMIVLFYTPAVHTSISILHCPSFPVLDINSTGFSTEARWFVNGNIQCFTGAHIALSLFAIVVLLFSFSLVPLLLLVIFAEEKQLSRRPRWFELAVVAFEQSFKYWWWGPLELFRRLILVILSVAFPRNNYPVIFTLALFTGVTSFIKPYGNRESHKTSNKGYTWAVNVLDVFLAGNILILLLLRNTQYVKDTYEELPFVETAMHGCGVESELTNFAIILTPLYYLPLLVAIFALLVWLISVITRAMKGYRDSRGNKDNGEREGDDIGMKEVRAMTQTVVDIRSYDPDEVDPPMVSLSPGTPLDSISLSATSKIPSLSLTSWIHKLSRRGSSRKKTKEVTVQVELKGVEERISEEKWDIVDKDTELEPTHKEDLAIQDNNYDQQSICSSDSSITEI